MKPKIALQLWSIQEACKADLHDALQQVKKAGYQGVEFAGYHGHSASEITQWLTELELEPVASHIPFEALSQHFEETIAFEKEIGNQRIVIPYAAFDTYEKWQAFIQELGEIATKLKKAGFTCFYHNHAHEFSEVEGVSILDELLTHTSDVKLETDLYWLAYAGVDVVSWVTKRQKRIGLFHIKDMLENPKESTEIAKGILPIKEYVALGKELDIPWLIVEQEAFQQYQPLEAVAIDYLQLKELVEEVHL